VRNGHRALWIGLVAAAISTFALCCAVAVITKPLGTGDETSHLDYAIQVWHGHLPVFQKGLQSHPPKFAVTTPVQLEAQHPPLFYVIMAPIAGPLADAGRWVAATLAVRVANSLLTVLIVLAVGWTAWVIGGRERASRAITATSVAATIGAVVYVGGTAFSDTLVTLMSALAIGIALFAVTRGLTWRVLVAACVVSAAGALARAEFVMALAVLAVALALAVFIHGTPRADRFGARLLTAITSAVLPILSAAAAAGWFYVRNHRLTGNFSGSEPGYAAQAGRHTRTFTQVVTNSDFLNTQYSLLRHPIDGRNLSTLLQHRIDTPVMITVFALVVVLGLVVLIARLGRAVRRRDRVRLAVIGLLAMQTVLTIAFEISFIMGEGGSISRYLLPALVPITLLITAGLRLGPRGAHPYFLGIYLLICHGMFCYWLLDQPHAPGTTPTGVPWHLVLVVPPVVIVLAVVQAAAVRAARSTEATRSSQPLIDATAATV
jgi:4-amino-4-deoxy-L-arabinose transferase-like glycosyltransferase